MPIVTEELPTLPYGMQLFVLQSIENSGYYYCIPNVSPSPICAFSTADAADEFRRISGNLEFLDIVPEQVGKGILGTTIIAYQGEYYVSE